MVFDTGRMCGKKPDEAGGSTLFALGRQVTVEFYDCNPGALADEKLLERVFVEAARASGATVINSVFHAFEPQGVSGVVVISESHFAVHAWPEHDYAAVDIFTCGGNIDFEVAIQEIAAGIGCREWIVSSAIHRGIVGNNGVERLVPVTEQAGTVSFQLSWRQRFEETAARAFSSTIDVYNCLDFEFGSCEALKKFIDEFTEKMDFEIAGELHCSHSRDCCAFEQPLVGGRLAGLLAPDKKTVYLDIFVNGFFDPRLAAETAMAGLGGKYYRMQPQIRQ